MKKAELVGVLEQLCQALELSDAQYQLAKRRYEGVGEWLADADSSLLRAISIYLQGSTAIGTTVKPIGCNEHDVDLVAHVSNLGLWLPPAALKKAIGGRLRANGHYARILEEMPRCWRLNYANEFHMDITPSIPNPNCDAGGELVPDRALKEWKESNPKGYKSLFMRRASLLPQMRLSKSMSTDGLRAAVEPYPAIVVSREFCPGRSRSRSDIATCTSSILILVLPQSPSSSLRWHRAAMNIAFHVLSTTANSICFAMSFATCLFGSKRVSSGGCDSGSSGTRRPRTKTSRRNGTRIPVVPRRSLRGTGALYPTLRVL
jgi:hypothetical protein